MGQPASDDAAVKHSFPLVFLRDAERREVMNGGHGGAGLTPQHAAVAGDMQDIDLPATGEGRQPSLVPPDVIHGRAKTLRNLDKAHLAFCKIEQRQVVLENKQRELVVGAEFFQSAYQSEDVLCDAASAALDHGSGNADSHRSLRLERTPHRGPLPSEGEREIALRVPKVFSMA